MRLIGLAVVLALGLFAPLVAGAQQAGKVYRIGGCRAAAAPRHFGRCSSKRSVSMAG